MNFVVLSNKTVIFKALFSKYFSYLKLLYNSKKFILQYLS
jgi:hypothetical protein